MTQVKMTRELEQALLESIRAGGDWRFSEDHARNYGHGIRIDTYLGVDGLRVHLPHGEEIGTNFLWGWLEPWRWRLWFAVRNAWEASKPKTADLSQLATELRRRSGSLVVPA